MAGYFDELNLAICSDMIKEKEIPLTIEVLSDNDNNEFLIHSKKEIRHILQTICTRSTRAAVYYNEGYNFALTMLLGVDEAGIWIDPPSRPRDSRNVLNSDRIIFVSAHNQAKVQFVSAEARQGSYNGRDAIFMALPERLLRLQRRDYFRLTSSPKNPLTCVIKPAQNHEDRKHEAAIMDISVGGVSLVYQETALELLPGKTYSNCEIELPNVGNIIATVQVRSAFDNTARAGRKMRRAGCAFVNPNGNVTNLLQRYVAQMQYQVATTRE